MDINWQFIDIGNMTEVSSNILTKDGSAVGNWLTLQPRIRHIRELREGLRSVGYLATVSECKKIVNILLLKGIGSKNPMFIRMASALYFALYNKYVSSLANMGFNGKTFVECLDEIEQVLKLAILSRDNPVFEHALEVDLTTLPGVDTQMARDF